MATMEERLAARLAPLGAAPQKMFGGVCFMLNGNMAVCTSKRGLLVRVGAENAAKLGKGRHVKRMEMGGRTMVGYLFVDETALNDEAEFERWIGLALAYNKTLPPKAQKAKRK